VSESTGFKGCIQVYTGDGKGKTTAALGLAFRAAGRGLRTYFGQFLKARTTGELSAAGKLSPLITIEQFGRTGFLQVTDDPGDEDTTLAKTGLRKCREAMLSGDYDIVVLDEVLAAVGLKVLSEKEVLDLLDARPESVEIVLTGRSATQALVDRADLVTEMKLVKHYFARGIRARDGIER
jgi:cob(I)alamin adenosyltransferase